ncbi:MAG: zinc ribbon domain-containing protein [Phycisphaerales bacterium]
MTKNVRAPREPEATLLRLTTLDAAQAVVALRSVRRATRRRVAGPVLAGIFFGVLVAMISLVLLAILGVGIVENVSSPLVANVVGLLVVFAPPVVGVYAGIKLFLRQRVMQSRIEIVARLAERSCFGCGYRLRGVATGPSGTCRCPECGVESPVMRTEVSAAAALCPRCGSELDGQAPDSLGAVMCTGCGHRTAGLVRGDLALIAAATGRGSRADRRALARSPANPEPSESLLALSTARPRDLDDLAVGLVARFPGFGTLPLFMALAYAMCGAVLLLGAIIGLFVGLDWVLGLAGVDVPRAFQGPVVVMVVAVGSLLLFAFLLQRGVAAAWRQIVVQVLADGSCFTCGAMLDRETASADGIITCRSCDADNPMPVDRAEGS